MMSYIKGRLRRLEGRMQGGRCPEYGLTPDGPGHIVLIDDGRPAEGFPDDPCRGAQAKRRSWGQG